MYGYFVDILHAKLLSADIGFGQMLFPDIILSDDLHPVPVPPID
jgi:hypothetical protein